MSELIEVYVNDRVVTIYSGMKVKHTLIAHDPGAYEACRKGVAAVRNEDGFFLGLEGALQRGARLFVTRKE